MDKANLRNMYRICGGDFNDKMHLLMEYAVRPEQEVADPWYTDDFDATWRDVLNSPDTGRAPILSGTSAVYGRVCGDVHLTDTALIISGEEICNDSLDTLVMDGKGRSVIRDPSRDELAPQKLEPQKKKSKKKGMER